MIEFGDKDSPIFDEIMRALEKHPAFERLKLNDETILSLFSFEIYSQNWKIYRDCREIHLTVKEYDLLSLLLANRDCILTYEQMYQKDFVLDLYNVKIEWYNLINDKIGGKLFMKERAYHHGDLRRALIEMGIEFIKQEGEEALSLRKIAEMCGVSNAAPYAHFKTKDEFIVAMQRYVMDLFATALEKTVTEYKDSPSLLPMLGKTYVMFFYQNPFYYDFLFSRKNISIKLSLGSTDTDENPPLAILQKTATLVFRKVKLPEKVIQDKIIAMWALVHGLAAIVTMPNIEYDDNWETRIEEIIKSISIPYQMQEAKE